MSGNLPQQQRSAFITSPKRLIPILIIFAFAVLIVWAMREHLRFNGEATLSYTQRIEFKQWATTPLKLPAKSLVPLPLPTAEFMEQHTLLLDDFLQLYNSIALQPPADTNPCTALDKWDCLTSEDIAKLLREIPPLAKRAKTLTESPFYSVLPHLRFATNRKMSGDDCEKIAAFNFVLSAYTKLQVIQGNNTEAIDEQVRITAAVVRQRTFLL